MGISFAGTRNEKGRTGNENDRRWVGCIVRGAENRKDRTGNENGRIGNGDIISSIDYM